MREGRSVSIAEERNQHHSTRKVTTGQSVNISHGVEALKDQSRGESVIIHHETGRQHQSTRLRWTLFTFTRLEYKEVDDCSLIAQMTE